MKREFEALPSIALQCVFLPWPPPLVIAQRHRLNGPQHISPGQSEAAEPRSAALHLAQTFDLALRPQHGATRNAKPQSETRQC